MRSMRLALRGGLVGFTLTAAVLAGTSLPAAAFHEGVHVAQLSGEGGVTGVAVIKCVLDRAVNDFVCHEEVNTVGLAPGTYSFFVDNTFICSFTVSDQTGGQSGCTGDVLVFTSNTATVQDASGNVVASGPFEFHGP